MKFIRIEKVILMRILRYITRHLSKDELFAPRSPNGDPLLIAGSSYHEDIYEGRFFQNWILNQLGPNINEERRKLEQLVFDWYDCRA